MSAEEMSAKKYSLDEIFAILTDATSTEKYSLNEIFANLRDATSNLRQTVVLLTEDKHGTDIEIKMKLPDY